MTGLRHWLSQKAVHSFYPSFGGSVLLNKFVDMGKNIDLFKFRASYSIVGNDVPVFMSNLLYSLGSQGAITPPTKLHSEH